jgi:hypothetical protein
VVAIVYVPLVFVVILSAPIWLLAALRPQSHGEMALKLLDALRYWSRDVMRAVGGRAL